MCRPRLGWIAALQTYQMRSKTWCAMPQVCKHGGRGIATLYLRYASAGECLACTARVPFKRAVVWLLHSSPKDTNVIKKTLELYSHDFFLFRCQVSKSWP
jgi:hypothetical protein